MTFTAEYRIFFGTVLFFYWFNIQSTLIFQWKDYYVRLSNNIIKILIKKSRWTNKYHGFTNTLKDKSDTCTTDTEHFFFGLFFFLVNTIMCKKEREDYSSCSQSIYLLQGSNKISKKYRIYIKWFEKGGFLKIWSIY